MDKLVQWWKQDERYVTLTKAILLAAVPVLCSIVYCAVQGKTIGQVYLPASEWNDELFYYKQVEGIVHYGWPQGYFGFNESHALRLSFAAWSPVLVFPWVLWGLLFGWNLVSPILCNIVLMAFCCFLFVWLVKPEWKQMGKLVLLFCLYYPFIRYMLAGMPEVICFTMVILFYGLAINYRRREKGWKLMVLFVMAGWMTLMRPYLVLFMLLPICFWIMRSGWKGVLGSALTLVATMGLYVWIKHYLGAAYFEPLFSTDWISVFFERGIWAGLYFMKNRLSEMGCMFLRFCLEAFRSGMAAGAFFNGSIAILLVLVIQILSDCLGLRHVRNDKEIQGSPEVEIIEGISGYSNGEVDKKRGENKKIADRLMIETHLAFSIVAMVIAILLMYKLTEGSKHLLTFIAAGIFVVAMTETKAYIKIAFLGAVFLFFYYYKAVSSYDYQVPFITEDRSQQIEKWTTELSGRMTLERTDSPSFDNVVIWVTYDTTQDGAISNLWQILYSLPEGFGISCCQPDYIQEHFDSLESRYLFGPSGGNIDASCRKAGYREIWRDETAVLYQRY